MTDAKASVPASERTDSSLRPESSARAALDTAQKGIQSVAKMLGRLDEVGKDPDKTEGLDFRPISDCLVGILQSKKREEAFHNLVKRVAFELPGCTVRFAQGKADLKSLIDHRLGWLAASNEIHQEMAVVFRDAHVEKEGVTQEASRLRKVAGFWVLDLSWDESAQRCLLFLQAREAHASAEITKKTDPGIERERLHWLTAGGDVLAEALASRPLVHLPRVVNLVGHRPLFTILGTLFLMVLLAGWPVHYPVVCEAIVEPLYPRVVASPFDATLAELHVWLRKSR